MRRARVLVAWAAGLLIGATLWCAGPAQAVTTGSAAADKRVSVTGPSPETTPTTLLQLKATG
jgi:hypothetical protein